jgi:hypothetical protein
MLISIHIPKTAGNSLRESLMRAYGADRVFRDYGDWAGFDEPFANRRRDQRRVAMRARRDELAANYDVIHGHFIADKYIGLFPQTDFLAFFRDPCQQVMSHWRYQTALTDRVSDVNKEVHIEVRYFKELKPSLEEYIEWPFYRNHQSQFMGSLSVDDLAFVGLYEEYDRTIALASAQFARDLGPPHYAEVTKREAPPFVVSEDMRRRIRKYYEADFELYARARERFARQEHFSNARQQKM